MFSDQLCDSYQKIYEGIKKYDYCHEERDKIIAIMTEINILIFRYDSPNPIKQNDVVQRARAKNIAEFDFKKATQKIEYTDEPYWKNYMMYLF